MNLSVSGLNSQEFSDLLNGGNDANNQLPEPHIAEPGHNPCRHCLGFIKEGEPMLILAHRPFTEKQPYAEVGPIFLHAESCPHYSASSLPAWFVMADQLLVRGYTAQDRINYDTAAIVSGEEIESRCKQILERSDVAYVHIRPRKNNHPSVR